ncbi:hypothetical protein [Trinickia dinghuensis]|uniref:hypothetical protein n=1 Tax=Trinickia dinghuensis TaxID=2291023 RepID=UPI0015F14E57|nr:hypothetical protein [Trinickia dinghuensis]
MQPARFNGWNAAGEMLWNFMGFDGSSNWPVLWIGAALEATQSPLAITAVEALSKPQ